MDSVINPYPANVEYMVCS